MTSCACQRSTSPAPSHAPVRRSTSAPHLGTSISRCPDAAPSSLCPCITVLRQPCVAQAALLTCCLPPARAPCCREPAQGGEHGEADNRLQLGPGRCVRNSCQPRSMRPMLPLPRGGVAAQTRSWALALLSPLPPSPIQPPHASPALPPCPPSSLHPASPPLPPLPPSTLHRPPAGTGCSTWTGVRLCDLLRLVGIRTPAAGAKHVCFRGPKGEAAPSSSSDLRCVLLPTATAPHHPPRRGPAAPGQPPASARFVPPPPGRWLAAPLACRRAAQGRRRLLRHLDYLGQGHGPRLRRHPGLQAERPPADARPRLPAAVRGPRDVVRAAVVNTQAARPGSITCAAGGGARCTYYLPLAAPDVTPLCHRALPLLALAA